MKKSKKPVNHNALLVLFILVQLSLFIIKTVGIVAWSWWIIASPVIIAIACLVIAVIIIVLFWNKIFDGEDE